MTNQEIFDKVAHHLLTQRQVSRTEGCCRYRDDHGLKCAIGCLIPDEIYDPTIEEATVGTRKVMGLLSRAGVIPEYDQVHVLLTDFLQDLQLVHDDCEVDRWAERLTDLAGTWKLSPHAIKESHD
jgi:hypothetical protein